MTLTELLLVLSLMSLTLLFLPASNEQLTQKNQRINLENQLTNIIQFSRNMAMAKGQNLAINSLSGDEYWSSGMVLFVDNPSHHYTVKDKVLRRWRWTFSRDIQLNCRGFQSNQFIVFSHSLRHSAMSGHFDIWQEGRLMKQIVVNRLGTTRIKSMSYE